MSCIYILDEHGFYFREKTLRTDTFQTEPAASPGLALARGAARMLSF